MSTLIGLPDIMKTMSGIHNQNIQTQGYIREKNLQISQYNQTMEELERLKRFATDYAKLQEEKRLRYGEDYSKYTEGMIPFRSQDYRVNPAIPYGFAGMHQLVPKPQLPQGLPIASIPEIAQLALRNELPSIAYDYNKQGIGIMEKLLSIKDTDGVDRNMTNMALKYVGLPSGMVEEKKDPARSEIQAIKDIFGNQLFITYNEKGIPTLLRASENLPGIEQLRSIFKMREKLHEAGVDAAYTEDQIGEYKSILGGGR